MLQKLSIRNYALIDSVELELDKGLNIITGETGAGKSIILGALSLILGQRAETKYFFNQEKKCIIEGQFLLPGDDLQTFFEDNEIDFYRECILRREISTDGKSRAFINDTPVTLNLMKQVGEQLIDIHSQHATLEVNDPTFQLLLVDTLSDHQPLLSKYRLIFKQYRKNQVQLKLLKEASADAESRRDYEQYLFNELEAASLKETEQESLENELQVLNNAEAIKRGLTNAVYLLTEQDGSVLQLLKEAIQQLQGLERFSSDYTQLNQRLRSTLIELKDISSETSGLNEGVIFNPVRIEEISGRLDLIYSLQQKHKVATVSELFQVQERLSNNLSSLQSGEVEIQQLEAEISAAEQELNNTATRLSANRSKAISTVEVLVGEVLSKAGMSNARIKLEHQQTGELNKDGRDSINLLFSANVGQAPAPVGKVASGGELSRLMLAIKSIMAKHTALPTLIFDEIDTGISGETAVRVGNVIGELEHNMQVICITHLPQIAAKGDSHYYVYKNEAPDKTTTGIRKMAVRERVEAIAEMLSGKDPGISAIKNAEELLGIR